MVKYWVEIIKLACVALQLSGIWTYFQRPILHRVPKYWDRLICLSVYKCTAQWLAEAGTWPGRLGLLVEIPDIAHTTCIVDQSRAQAWQWGNSSYSLSRRNHPKKVLKNKMIFFVAVQLRNKGLGNRNGDTQQACFISNPKKTHVINLVFTTRISM